MIASITKGSSFGRCVDYVLSRKDAELIAAKDVLLMSIKTIAESMKTQAQLNPKLGKTVGHISLNFHPNDKEKADNVLMWKIVQEYMRKMGITDTQYIVARHYDTDHPHCHIVFNRVGNSGKTISDRNDRYRSVEACKELTEKYGLYISPGKENVNRERLRGKDKTKYEIYDAIKSALPRCLNWGNLRTELLKSGITTEFKTKGGTDLIEGVKFAKDGQTFSGSKVDRQLSFLKLHAALNDNKRRYEESQTRTRTESPATSTGRYQGYGQRYDSRQDFQHNGNRNYSDNHDRPDNNRDRPDSHAHDSGSILGNLFELSGYDPDLDPLEAEARRARKKKKKKKGIRM